MVPLLGWLLQKVGMAVLSNLLVDLLKEAFFGKKVSMLERSFGILFWVIAVVLLALLYLYWGHNDMLFAVVSPLFQSAPLTDGGHNDMLFAVAIFGVALISALGGISLCLVEDDVLERFFGILCVCYAGVLLVLLYWGHNDILFAVVIVKLALIALFGILVCLFGEEVKDRFFGILFVCYAGVLLALLYWGHNDILFSVFIVKLALISVGIGISLWDP